MSQDLIETDVPMTHEESLAFTQGLRKRLVHDLTAGCTKIPTSPEEAKLMLETLNDMDRTTLGHMRQKSEDKTAARDQLLAEAMLQFARQAGSKSLFRSNEVPDVVERVPRRPPIDDSLLPEIELLPGELDVGLHNISYNELSDRFSRSNVPQLPHKKD